MDNSWDRSAVAWAESAKPSLTSTSTTPPSTLAPWSFSCRRNESRSSSSPARINSSCVCSIAPPKKAAYGRRPAPEGPLRAIPSNQSGTGPGSASGPRMRLEIHLSQPPVADQRVHLRGSEARVPQQFLHHPYVRTRIEHVGGERVPQGVRGNPILEPSRAGVPLQYLPTTLTAQPTPPGVQEHSGARPPLGILCQ